MIDVVTSVRKHNSNPEQQVEKVKKKMLVETRKGYEDEER